jgi:hypothetical protein
MDVRLFALEELDGLGAGLDSSGHAALRKTCLKMMRPRMRSPAWQVG